jgi:hypothetical protein
VDGYCRFRVAACVNQPNVEGCQPSPLHRVRARAKSLLGVVDIGTGLPLDGTSVCGSFVDLVALAGTRANRT